MNWASISQLFAHESSTTPPYRCHFAEATSIFIEALIRQNLFDPSKKLYVDQHFYITEVLHQSICDPLVNDPRYKARLFPAHHLAHRLSPVVTLMRRIWAFIAFNNSSPEIPITVNTLTVPLDQSPIADSIRDQPHRVLRWIIRRIGVALGI